MASFQTCLQVRMLGGFSIECQGKKREYHVRAHKNWLLIAYLLLNRDRVVPRKELVNLFKDSAYSTDANRMLRNRLLRVKKNLQCLSELVGEDLILIYHDGCRWNPNVMVQFDTETFCQLCQKARRTDGKAGLELKETIRQLYGAGFLPMFEDEWLNELQKRYAALKTVA